MMFLSPCLEAEELFAAAGTYRVDGILLLALEYAVMSIAGVLLLVVLAFKIIQPMNSPFIIRNEKKITGLVLVSVGILSFFIH